MKSDVEIAQEAFIKPIREIAEILGIGRTSAYKLIHSGVFQIVKIGSTIRISKASFDEWLDKQV